MKEFTKDEITKKMKELKEKGWIPLTKHREKKDGGIGNTLEDLLGIPENNLEIADLGTYELKTHRKQSDSLISLKRQEPGPGKRDGLIPQLIKTFGWDFPNCDKFNKKGKCEHDRSSGQCYPKGEQSLRIDMDGKSFSERGFRIKINKECKRLIIEFDLTQVKLPDHKSWLDEVQSKAGSGYLDTKHHWPFKKLQSALERKMKNMLYVTVCEKEENGVHYMKIDGAFFLGGYDFDNFLNAIKNGQVQVEFNARTHHNHGTAFRTWERYWPSFYSTNESLF